MTHAKQNQKYQLHQYKDPMAWVVRHCSPSIVVCDTPDAHRHGDQSDPSGFGNWCAPVDWSCVRFQDTD